MNILYVWAFLLSCFGLYLLNRFGFRPLLLEEFDFKVRGLQADLLDLLLTGCVSADADAVRRLERLLSGLIQIAPTLDLLEFSQFRVKEDGRQSKHDYPTPELSFEAQLVELQPYVQHRLREINEEAMRITMSFMLRKLPFSSIVSYIAYLFGTRARATNPMHIVTGKAYTSGTEYLHSQLPEPVVI